MSRASTSFPATAAGSRDRSTGAEDAGAALLPASEELKHFGQGNGKASATAVPEGHGQEQQDGMEALVGKGPGP